MHSILDYFAASDDLLRAGDIDVELAILQILQSWDGGPTLQRDSATLANYAINGFPPLGINGFGHDENEGQIAARINSAWGRLVEKRLLEEVRTWPGTFQMTQQAYSVLRDPSEFTKGTNWRLPKSALHPRLQKSAWPSYHASNFHEAARGAMTSVEEALKEATRSTAFGRALVDTAFSVEKGVLSHGSEKDKKACLELFVGAFSYLRNGTAHHNDFVIYGDEASEILAFASYLLRLIDRAVVLNGGHP